MPRNSTGNYTLPAGNPVVPDTLIETGWANPTMSDIGAAITDSLDRQGRGTMLAPLKIIDGTVVSPALSFNSDSATGLFRLGAGQLGFAIAGILGMSLGPTGLALATGLHVPGSTFLDGPVVLGGALTIAGDTTFTGRLSLQLGTAPLPALNFTGDPNTGMWSPGADQMAWSQNGFESARFDASARFNAGFGGGDVSTPAYGGLVASSKVNSLGDINVVGFNTFPSVGQRFARGAPGAPTSVDDGDRLGGYFAGGYHSGIAGGWMNPAAIFVEVDGATAGTTVALPSRLRFFTSQLNGGRVERLRINSVGQATFALPSTVVDTVNILAPTGAFGLNIVGQAGGNARIQFNDPGVRTWGIGTKAGDLFTLRDGSRGADVLQVNNVGQVIIPAPSTAVQCLVLAQAAVITADTAAFALYLKGRTLDNIGAIQWTTNAGVEYARWVVTPDGGVQFNRGATPGTLSMILDGAGNLGLGVAPTARLDLGSGSIIGVSNIGGFSDASAYTIWGGKSISNGGYMQLYGSGSAAPYQVLLGNSAAGATITIDQPGAVRTIIGPAVGDNSNRVATTAFLQTSTVGGASRTWQNMTGSRNLGSTFTSPAWPIELSINFNFPATAGTNAILNIAGAQVAMRSNGTAGAYSENFSAVIPPNTQYTLQNTVGVPVLVTWYELR